MDWIQFLQIICVPAFGWFFYKLGEQRKEIKLLERDLNEFKVAVAEAYINTPAYAEQYMKIQTLTTFDMAQPHCAIF